MIRLIPYLFLLLLSIPAWATRISGTAKSYAGREIKLQVFNDLFTLTQNDIAHQIIDESGQFSFDFDPGQVRLITLRIGEHRSNFYVAPNGEYSLSLEAWYAQSDAPLSPDKYLPATLLAQDPDSVNPRVSQINFYLEDFQQKNYMQFIRGNAKKTVAKLKTNISEEFASVENDFLKDYLKYKIARQEYNARIHKDTLFQQYLSSGEIHFQNPAFADFYESYYNKWFNRYNLSGEKERIKRYIEETGDADSLMQLIQNHDFIANVENAELITIMELHRLSQSTEGYTVPAITRMIGKLEARTTSVEIREIARYYLRKLKRLAPGNPAPSFVLKDRQGNEHSLEDYRGKYVYLDFWATWCSPCIKAMPALNEVHTLYGDSLVVISISVDQRIKRYEHFVDSHEYPWLFLYAGDDAPIKEDYEVVAMPTYCLIDPEGKIMQYPALSPGHGVKAYFEYLFDSSQKKTPEVWDWKNAPKKAPKKESDD
ncbi:TlpA family protein disulfide reductase [bacterium SCSIO 12741]|nr:TlpA family protein disulfide reductase [bacterium SCSIO 12741]